MSIADDPHTLTGAYAVHALDDDERAAVEGHLDHCDTCAQEVRELTETASRLGLAVAVSPRRGMRDDVLRRIATVRQDVPRAEPGRPAADEGRVPDPAVRRNRRVPQWALAACVAAVAVLGGTALWQYQQARDAREEARQTQEQAREQVQQQSQELAAVLAAPDVKSRTGRLGDGASGTVVVSDSRNQAVFIAAGLPEPPRGKVYQLWFDDGGAMRPAGLMDSGRGTEAMLMDGPVDRATGMGITLEPAGGSARPTTAPVALMDFPS
ncbi:anti-sigma factor domain-containing protein [Streptomyces sp. NPDC018029]|uniref:anti-sigma factor n=1 Tax=Streptomyces sp. NPDC018029 TaxID=3365032 RepID=UPI003798AC0A